MRGCRRLIGNAVAAPQQMIDQLLGDYTCHEIVSVVDPLAALKSQPVRDRLNEIIPANQELWIVFHGLKVAPTMRTKQEQA